jgi:hypothetical protein
MMRSLHTALSTAPSPCAMVERYRLQRAQLQSELLQHVQRRRMVTPSGGPLA